MKVHSRAELQEAVQDNGRAGTFAGDRGTEGPSGAPELWMPCIATVARSSRWASSDRHSMRGPCRWGSNLGEVGAPQRIGKKGMKPFWFENWCPATPSAISVAYYET